MKDKTTALILTCIGFVGFAGIQWFYLKKPLKGLLWLFTGGLFVVGTIYDLVTISDKVEQMNGMQAPRSSESAAQQIQRLAELKASGVLSEEEFERQKRKLLG